MLTFIFLFCESSWPGVPRLKTLGMQHIPAYFPQLRAVLPIHGFGSFHIDADPDPNLEPAPCQSYAGLWFTAPWLHFEPPCLNCERPRPSKGPQLLNVDFHFLFCESSWPGVPCLKTLGMQHIPAYFPQLRAVLPILSLLASIVGVHDPPRVHSF
jgi:hypothetical protein